MTVSRIGISRDHLQQIEDLARAAYPREACGLLVGQLAGETALVTRFAESRNLAGEKAPDLFEIDPKLQFALMRDLRETDEAILL